jgi:hypothetical protein
LTWQDWALAAINLGFLPTLVPMVRRPVSEPRPPLRTSVTTACLLAASASVVLTLGLWLTAVCQTAMCAQWVVLVCQERRRCRLLGHLMRMRYR